MFSWQGRPADAVMNNSLLHWDLKGRGFNRLREAQTSPLKGKGTSASHPFAQNAKGWGTLYWNRVSINQINAKGWDTRSPIYALKKGFRIG
jgi:hypothetical protein